MVVLVSVSVRAAGTMSMMGMDMNMGGGGNDTASLWCGAATPMFMGFNGGTTQLGSCSIFLFPELVLNTPAKFAFAWMGTVGMGVSVHALAYLRNKHIIRALSSRPALRRGADVFLYMVQVIVTLFNMLIVMTYSGPLFIALVLGLTVGYSWFTEYPDFTVLSGAMTSPADANDCARGDCCLSESADNPSSMSNGSVSVA